MAEVARKLSSGWADTGGPTKAIWSRGLVSFICSASRTSRQDIAAALEHIDASKLLGTIFNRCEGRSAQYGAGYGFRPR